MEEQPEQGRIAVHIQADIVARRDGGASWKELEQAYGLTRQQARYAYQLGKRRERRRAGRGPRPASTTGDEPHDGSHVPLGDR